MHRFDLSQDVEELLRADEAARIAAAQPGPVLDAIKQALDALAQVRRVIAPREGCLNARDAVHRWQP